MFKAGFIATVFLCLLMATPGCSFYTYGDPDNLRGAEQGSHKAQYNLGRMYRAGDGVPKDLVQALKWMNIAASSPEDCPNCFPGDALVKQMYSDRLERAREARDQLTEEMTPAQIAEAERLAHEWWAEYKKRKGK